MLPSPAELKSAIERDVPGSRVTVVGACLVLAPADVVTVCRYLRDHADYALDYLSNLTVADYLPAATAAQAGPPKPDAPPVAESAIGVTAGTGRLQVVYHLYSMAQKHGPVELRVDLPRANPVVASVMPLWRGAEFQEREAFDLFGVRFEGHPDLRRILLWDGFEGHPLRKDYVVEDQDA